MAKEPGQTAYECFSAKLNEQWPGVSPRHWLEVTPARQRSWAAVEAACRAAALEEAAKVARTAWLTCPYGEIADADAMCALSEHTEAAIRALIPRPADGGEAG